MLSRLKGIETLSGKHQPFPHHGSLDMLSRLKGIETQFFGTLLTTALRFVLWICFPV